jgi:hypothetical protein
VCRKFLLVLKDYGSFQEVVVDPGRVLNVLESFRRFMMIPEGSLKLWEAVQSPRIFPRLWEVIYCSKIFLKIIEIF